MFAQLNFSLVTPLPPPPPPPPPSKMGSEAAAELNSLLIHLLSMMHVLSANFLPGTETKASVFSCIITAIISHREWEQLLFLTCCDSVKNRRVLGPLCHWGPLLRAALACCASAVECIHRQVSSPSHWSQGWFDGTSYSDAGVTLFAHVMWERRSVLSLFLSPQLLLQLRDVMCMDTFLRHHCENPALELLLVTQARLRTTNALARSHTYQLTARFINKGGVFSNDFWLSAVEVKTILCCGSCMFALYPMKVSLIWQPSQDVWFGCSSDALWCGEWWVVPLCGSDEGQWWEIWLF